MTKVYFPSPSKMFVQQQKQRLSLKSSVRPQSRVCPTTKEETMTKLFFPFPSQLFFQQQKQGPWLKSSFPLPSKMFVQQQKKSPCPKSSKSFSTVISLSSKNRTIRFPHMCREMSWIEEKWRENPRPEWNFFVVKFPDRRRTISCASLFFLRGKKFFSGKISGGRKQQLSYLSNYTFYCMSLSPSPHLALSIS